MILNVKNLTRYDEKIFFTFSQLLVLTLHCFNLYCFLIQYFNIVSHFLAISKLYIILCLNSNTYKSYLYNVEFTKLQFVASFECSSQ